ncbi:PAS domain-containing hybrid sensor histidine kinase/response regulator [Ignavibacterium album]|uniref:PAS domain-containing hybrid sensor histidine kinase/response regulator n=1 Tax=Ignavibacterium album TaxID=591197 RepID=UPI0026EFB563|nr:PAS domain-containing hybrid sensor histidine kinase/response regulator [Ignavibacterium album]
MSQTYLASLIQRAYRIIGSSDNTCQMLDSLCKLLSSEKEFAFVWIEPIDASLKQDKICFAKEGYFEKHDNRLIIQHFSECSSLKSDRDRCCIHRISSDNNDRCFNIIKSYFPDKNSAAIFSCSIKYEQKVFAFLNILIPEINNVPEETFSLLRELADDAAFRINELTIKTKNTVTVKNDTAENHEYLKTLLHCMYEDIIVIDKNYTVIDVNNSKVKIADKKTEDVLGAKCYSVSHGFDKPCNFYGAECPIHEIFQTGKSKQVKHQILGSDGRKKYVDILFSPFINHNGEVEKVIETIRDVTDVVNARRELNEKVVQLKQIVNNLDVVFFNIDLNGSKPKLTYLSEGFTKIWGIDRTAALENQKIWFDSVYQDDRSKIFHIVREYMRTKDPNIKTEFRIIRNDDSLRWISVRTKIISVSSGNSNQIFGIAEDITEKKLLELEIQNAYAKAKESINFKNYLLGNINHEIRTPLNAILGFTQILKEETSKDMIDELADKILCASNRLLNTLDSIIELSDLQSDSRKIIYNEVSVYDLLKTVQHKFSSIAYEKKLLFEVIEPDQDVIIKSDEFLLKKILYQLLDNAFKYTHHGSVTLSIRFDIGENQNWLVLDVSDTGIGIDAEKLETIFEAFRQGSEGLARSYQGSGLGLTLTKKMIELLGGKISVESEPGIGSKFSVHIPFEFPSKKENHNGNNNGDSNLEGKRILIVEDNQLNAEVLRHYLKSIVNTDIAFDSQQAFELSEKYLYDLILMDISLKNGESGIEVMKKMKVRDEYRTVPIVALTAFTFDEDKNKFLAEGFDGFIPKPIQRNDLISEIKKVLHKY